MKIFVLIYHKLCEKYFVFALFFSYMLYIKYRKNEKMNEVLKKYTSDWNLTKSEISKIKKDLFMLKHHYKGAYKEYFWYDLYHKKYHEWKPFIFEKENKEMCIRLNANSPHLLFKDKKKTYDTFQFFFSRNAMLIEAASDKEKFMDFVAKIGKIIVKPTSLYGGKGIFVLNGVKEAEQIFDNNIKDYLQETQYIVEEYIQQDDSMSALNSTSINTLRIATFIDGKEIVKLYAALRIGRAGACVDNASSGGMSALVDIETGKVITGARDEDCGYYEKHPDTGTQILDFNIPRWQEAVSLAEKLAMVIPQQRYVGWDLACSKKGWIMVEGNAEEPQLLTQLASQNGIRPIFEKTVFKYL